MKIGNIIKPTKESGFHLRSGAGYYKQAVIISLEPFIITTEDSDMKWEATIKEEYFEVVGEADKATLEHCKRRLINKNTDMIDWTKVTDNEEIIRLIKEREKIEQQIRAIDEMALVRYELEALQE